MSSHAVVIGGSIGGLTAASVLAHRFDRVTVFDRDKLPSTAADRRGVPQGPHAHALLISGRMRLDELFPGLSQELIDGGAMPFDPGWNLLFCQMGALRTRFHSGLLGTSCGRAFLEHAVRARVTAMPNVAIQDETPVHGLTGDRDRVTGIRLGSEQELPADLVVDASGRGGARVDRWLEELGCQVPAMRQVKINVGYTTKLFRRRPGDLPDDINWYLMGAVPPGDKRAAAVAGIEGDQWLVTLGGWHGAHAPTDLAGFTAFAQHLPFPYIGELVANAEPVDDAPPRKFTYPAARRRLFERLRVPPAGYVALGDAICSFNPLYGQGMTIAATEALALGKCLDRHGSATPKLAHEYYRAAGKAINTPWQMSTGSDFMFPETEGPRPFGTGLVNRYVREVMMACHVSDRAHRVMHDVQHLLAEPSAVMRPGMIVHALRAARRSPARAAVRTGVHSAPAPAPEHAA